MEAPHETPSPTTIIIIFLIIFLHNMCIHLFIYDVYNCRKTHNNIFICFIVKLEYFFTTCFIENNRNLILFLKFDGYL
jgi:hypothetical protein